MQRFDENNFFSPEISDEFSELNQATSVEYHLWPLKPWLLDRQVTEICINRPGEVFIEKNGRWEQIFVNDLSLNHLLSLVTAIARFANQDISDTLPLLSAVLPEGERIQIVIPPACENNTISITIRKPSKQIFRFEDYEQCGFFSKIQPLSQDLPAGEKLLLSLKARGDYAEFIKKAVELEKVIVVAGATGSGKTTFMKTLVQSIPKNRRIITIEDVPELFLPNHPNHVHLFYPSEAKEEDGAIVTSGSLLRSCLRMKPDRILLAEVRGGEAYDFINAAASGHAGSITSCHAGSCELVFERLALMLLQNRQGRTLPYEIIVRLLRQMIDVVVHVHHFGESELGRAITQIWYDPGQKRGGVEGL